VCFVFCDVWNCETEVVFLFLGHGGNLSIKAESFIVNVHIFCLCLISLVKFHYFDKKYTGIFIDNDYYY